VRICPSCGEENSDGARFCQNCAGRTADRTADLERSIELFERKGVVPAVERVRGRLASLLGG
jgi:uncharacterized membrane protein YvbJ